MPFPSSKTNGFTLVELAIVIVIIGLLVGGVLQGQELIKQAQLRSSIKHLQSVLASYNTFKAKYNAVPGDFNRAVNMIGGADIANGNGNNKTEWDTIEGGVENYQFWYHMKQANILRTKPEYTLCMNSVTCPYEDFWEKNTFMYSYWRDMYNHVVPTQPPMGNSIIHIATLNGGLVNKAAFVPEEAWAIDDKIDDGRPSTGLFTSKAGMIDFTTPMTSSNCLLGTAYNLAEPAISCRSFYVID